MDVLPDCELCREAGGRVIWYDRLVRVVNLDDPDYPGFCRVVLQRHVREMSDLTLEQRNHVMQVVYHVELGLRKVMEPDKINLASLGNQTPHVHWHVIPRWCDDARFPGPIWAAARALPEGTIEATPEHARRWRLERVQRLDGELKSMLMAAFPW